MKIERGMAVVRGHSFSYESGRAVRLLREGARRFGCVGRRGPRKRGRFERGSRGLKSNFPTKTARRGTDFILMIQIYYRTWPKLLSKNSDIGSKEIARCCCCSSSFSNLPRFCLALLLRRFPASTRNQCLLLVFINFILLRLLYSPSPNIFRVFGFCLLIGPPRVS